MPPRRTQSMSALQSLKQMTEDVPHDKLTELQENNEFPADDLLLLDAADDVDDNYEEEKLFAQRTPAPPPSNALNHSTLSASGERIIPKEPGSNPLESHTGTSVDGSHGPRKPRRRRSSSFSIARQKSIAAFGKVTRSSRRASSPVRKAQDDSTIVGVADPTTAEAARSRRTMDSAFHNYSATKLRLMKGIMTKGGNDGKGIHFGVARTIGRRPYQEDRSAAFPSFECRGIRQSQSFFGVFDGHAGDRCSSYCSEEVPIRLKQTLTSKNIDVKEAFVSCFEGVDEDFCLKARHLMIDDGTTSNCVLIRGKQLWCANAGDSRSVLSRNAIAVPLSLDHKPERPDEMKRVTDLGGFVKRLGVWRVQGVLSMSRAIGDLSLKPYVIATPDVVKVELTNQDSFVCMASDGLWDVMDDQDVVDFLHSRPHLIRKPESAARALVIEAFRRGSRDNITVQVIFMDPSRETIDY